MPELDAKELQQIAAAAGLDVPYYDAHAIGSKVRFLLYGGRILDVPRQVTTSSRLEAMSRTQLLAVAKAAGLKHRAKATRQELIQLISGANHD